MLHLRQLCACPRCPNEAHLLCLVAIDVNHRDSRARLPQCMCKCAADALASTCQDPRPLLCHTVVVVVARQQVRSPDQNPGTRRGRRCASLPASYCAGDTCDESRLAVELEALQDVVAAQPCVDCVALLHLPGRPQHSGVNTLCTTRTAPLHEQQRCRVHHGPTELNAVKWRWYMCWLIAWHCISLSAALHARRCADRLVKR